jgi:hypothetical protein
MESISALNTEATVFISLATALAGFAVSIWANAAFYTTLTPVAKLATSIGAPVLIVIGLAFAFLGGFTMLRRAGLWRRIKTESYPVEAAVPPKTEAMIAQGSIRFQRVGRGQPVGPSDSPIPERSA